jgi:hypothetical protein
LRLTKGLGFTEAVRSVFDSTFGLSTVVSTFGKGFPFSGTSFGMIKGVGLNFSSS